MEALWFGFYKSPLGKVVSQFGFEIFWVHPVLAYLLKEISLYFA
jgi:hypothetical protein